MVSGAAAYALELAFSFEGSSPVEVVSRAEGVEFLKERKVVVMFEGRWVSIRVPDSRRGSMTSFDREWDDGDGSDKDAGFVPVGVGGVGSD